MLSSGPVDNRRPSSLIRGWMAYRPRMPVNPFNCFVLGRRIPTSQGSRSEGRSSILPLLSPTSFVGTQVREVQGSNHRFLTAGYQQRGLRRGKTSECSQLSQGPQRKMARGSVFEPSWLASLCACVAPPRVLARPQQQPALPWRP